MKTASISMAITIAVLSFISIKMDSSLQRKASNIKLADKMKDTDFKYANWAKAIEIFGCLFLITIPALLLFLAEDTYDVVVSIVLMSIPLIIILYRIMSWDVEMMKLRGDKLIYSRGRFFPKETEIDLNRIERIELNHLRLMVYMRSRTKKVINLPVAFEQQVLIYKILQEYRSKETNLEHIGDNVY